MRMRSPSAAIAWQIVRGNRWGFLAVVLAIPFFGCLYRLLRVWGLSESFTGMGFIPMVFSFVALFVFFSLTERARRGGFSGFPTRLFTLPISTLRMVTSMVGSGIATVFLVYFAWAKWVYPMLSKPLPWWPVFLLISGIVSTQAIVWAFAGLPLGRLAVLGIVATLHLLIGLMPHVLEGSVDFSVRKAVVLCLIGTTVGAYLMALWGVQRLRHGGASNIPWWRRLWELVQVRDKVLTPRPAFKSPAQAQFWFEWSRAGRILPWSVFLLSAFVAGPLSLLAGKDPKVSAIFLSGILASPLVLAALIGKGFAKLDFWAKELNVPPFIAIKPVMPGELIQAKVKAAAISVLLSWGIVFGILALWFPFMADPEYLVEGWNFVSILYPGNDRYLIVAFAAVALIILTWKLMVGSIYAGVLGEVEVFVFSAFCGVFWLVFWATSGLWFSKLATDLELFVKILAWFFCVLLALKILGGLWCWNRSVNSSLVSQRNFFSYLAVWVFGTACLVALPIFLFPNIGWMKNLLILGAFLQVPFLRIGLASLALSANRHR